jgi:hypothetical protein
MFRLRKIFNSRAAKAAGAGAVATIALGASAFLFMHASTPSSAPVTSTPKTSATLSTPQLNTYEANQMTTQANKFAAGGADLEIFHPANATSGISGIFTLAASPGKTLLAQCHLVGPAQKTDPGKIACTFITIKTPASP